MLCIASYGMNITLKNLVGTILLTGAMFLFWVLDFHTYQKISVFRNAVDERESTVQEYETVLSSVAKMKKEYNQRLTDIRKFSAVIPVNKSSAELVSALENIAAQSGIQLGQITFNTSTPNQELPYKILAVTINARGGYLGLTTFLNALEKNIRLLDVDTAEASLPEAIQTSTLDIKIQANAYF